MGMFEIALFGAIINCLAFHMHGDPANLFLGFMCAFGAALGHITTPAKDDEENDDEF